jgi:hypothetical protein
MRSTSSVDEQVKLDDAGSYDPLAETFDRFTTFGHVDTLFRAMDDVLHDEVLRQRMARWWEPMRSWACGFYAMSVSEE